MTFSSSSVSATFISLGCTNSREKQSQEATLEEARTNLTEAVAMVLQANRELAQEELSGQEVIREPPLLSVT